MTLKETTKAKVNVLTQPIQKATISPQDPSITWSSLYFLYLLIILVYIIPCFDVLYSGIGCITDDTSYINIIFCLNLTFFYFLYSLTLLCFFWNMWFLLYDSDSISHEVPLPSSLFSIQTLRTMFISVGGRDEEVSINLNFYHT